MKKPVIMRRTRLEAISTVVDGRNPWEWYRDRGYRVAKVEVREVEQ